MSTTTPVSFEVDEEKIAQQVKDVQEKLAGLGSEVLLDFFFAQQLDTDGLKALEELAVAAQSAGVKVVLRGINVDVYKVLKLAGLDARFVFVD